MKPGEMRAKADNLLDLVEAMEEGDPGMNGLEVAAAIWAVGAEVVARLDYLANIGDDR